MMKPDDIRKILERYYDGSATVGEIESVKRYFDETSDVPADLRADAAMFRAMSRHQQQVAPPADLEKKILAATVDASPAKRRFGWKIAFAAAAAAAVAAVQQSAAPVDTVAEIQKYKALLDAGVLTEEEFAAKKKQLLGI